MGEQPNPWDWLQPQDATSRHRTFSAVSGSADYIFTLLDQSERSACCGGRRFARWAEARHRGLAVAVVTGSCATLLTLVAVCADFPRYCPRHCVEGFTVISRFLDGISAVSPQIEVPNRAVDVNSWAR